MAPKGWPGAMPPGRPKGLTTAELSDALQTGTPTRVQVLDRAALAEVAQQVALKRPELIPKATLSRLRNRKSPFIASDTLATLQAALIEDGSTAARHLFWALDAAILSPGGLARRKAYGDWIGAQLRRFFFRADGRDGWRYDALDAAEWVMKNERAGALSLAELTLGIRGGGAVAGHALLRWGGFCALLERVEALAPAGAKLAELRQDFGDLNGRQGVERYVVALINILGPLLESPECAFVERQWEELDDSELAAFVLHGIARERVLLARGPFAERIQDLQRRASAVPEAEQYRHPAAAVKRTRAFNDEK